ncbi:MAG TPA: NAD(P)/FAD-dependent oxidoreductase [Methylococcaceae bacterium]|nr:NAD(P)/FAD-dependent oxidoreductase [Methylococcaceae bacterium]
MSHSHHFHALRRIVRLGRVFDASGLTTQQGLTCLQEARERRAQGISRREVLRGVAGLAAGAALDGLLGRPAWAAKGSPARVAVVGGGLAGLVCMDRLQANGVIGTLFEANTRLGGRCHSDRSTFPGQVAEMGGELIDNLHKTLLAYANEFNLLKEDYGKNPGSEKYFFFGSHHDESEVIDQYRVLIGRMRPDLQTLSGAPSFFEHTAADAALDRTSLGEYLERHCQDLPLIHRALEQAYIAEYGLELAEQSCLNFLLFIHLDGSAKFRPYGVFSDERYHLVGGNDAIAAGIRARLFGRVELGHELEALSRNASGEYLLQFRGIGTPETADAVVLAIPFSVLRRVTLDSSLGLSADKLRAIRELGYGANCKTMIGFDGRPWAEAGGNGGAYTDLPNVQNTWETNYSRGGAHGILTDYAGGNRAVALQIVEPPRKNASYCTSCHGGPGGFFDMNDSLIQAQAEAFLTDLDAVFPGALQAASGVSGKRVVQRGHWLPQRYARGSYTCYLPGQFTSIAGLESQAAGALKFAGEHADSFYSWQGFMEGACLSGIAAADAVLADMRAGRI